MTNTFGDREQHEGYTVLLMDAGAPKAVRWLPMPIAADSAAEAAAEWASDTGCEVQLLYRGAPIEAD